MENEQKKEYIKPELSVVEFECRSPLLDCSGPDDDVCVDFEGKDD